MRVLLIAFSLLFSFNLHAQLTEACKLKFGTNLGSVADYTTELPFVDLMHNAREWYTKDVGNPEFPFSSGNENRLTYRADGYPTHIPQAIDSSQYDQRVATVWGLMDGWPAGQYTVLWDGTGELDFWGNYQNLEQTSSNRLVFDVFDPIGNLLEMTILESDINDPVRNIRVLMPGTEDTYETDPFYDLWIERLSTFKSVRFMNWGATNNWGQPDPWTWDDPTLFDWSDRAQMNHYTWTTNKGVPYEMMIRLMNDYDLDGWVCVPHRTTDDFLENMAILFRDNLESERHLSIEYSNEIWNWMFGQTQWLIKYGCDLQNVAWPEGTVPYIQNFLDIWSTVFENQLDRLTRVAAVHTGWQDVSNRTVMNLTEGSYDAISPTFYFGISADGDAALDEMGDSATAEDIAYYTRIGMEEAKFYLQAQKSELSDPLGVPMVFYEGGQHITPQPFGEQPTYAQALLDIQRDTALYNLYNEWFDFMRTLQEGDEPLQLMHYAFIANRSARYGSWGMLETMNQDTDIVPAPKYDAILEAIAACDSSVSTKPIANSDQYQVFPNPVKDFLTIKGNLSDSHIIILNNQGQVILEQQVNSNNAVLNVKTLAAGTYILHISNEREQTIQNFVVTE